MTFLKNYTMNLHRNLTYSGTTNATLFLTRNDTIAITIAAPSEKWVWEDIKLNAYTRTLAVGSHEFPVIYKMHWGTGKGNTNNNHR